MNPIPDKIVIDLLSDTCFARSGAGGDADIVTEHDRYGLPIVRGTIVHHQLHETWAAMARLFDYEGQELFGLESNLGEDAELWIGLGTLDAATVQRVKWAASREEKPLSREMILRTFTVLRMQTREERATGAPAAGSLRSIRALRRGLTLEVPVRWNIDPDEKKLDALDRAVKATREMGLQRNRGMGHVAMRLGYSNEESAE